MADIRVGIVTWNTASVIDRCLAALPAALDGLDAEVVVVDNASSDDSAAIARRHDATVIENEENVGYARAMNQALRDTDAPVLLALNPDTEPPPRSLRTLHDRLLARPRCGLVVPRLVNADGSLQPSVQRFPSLPLALASGLLPRRLQRGALGRRWWLAPASPHDGQERIDWAIGAVHVIRRAALDRELPYSERWFMYVEDIELCWWLHEHGWEVRLEGDVAIPHIGNVSGAQAWGWQRSRRFWTASYDFDALARSPLHARAWGAINSAAVGLHWLANRVRGDDAHRDRSAQLRAELPVHVRAAAGRLVIEGTEGR